MKRSIPILVFMLAVLLWINACAIEQDPHSSPPRFAERSALFSRNFTNQTLLFSNLSEQVLCISVYPPRVVNEEDPNAIRANCDIYTGSEVLEQKSCRFLADSDQNFFRFSFSCANAGMIELEDCQLSDQSDFKTIAQLGFEDEPIPESLTFESAASFTSERRYQLLTIQEDTQGCPNASTNE